MILLMGEGSVADLLAQELAAERLISPTDLPQPRDPAGLHLLVWWREGRDWPEDLRLQRALRGQPLPWMPVWRAEDEIWIGPTQKGASPGCLACLRQRLRAASPEKATFDLFEQKGDTAPPTAIHPLFLSSIAALIAEEADLLRTGHSPRTMQAALCIDLRTGSVSTHRIVPDARCPECSPWLATPSAPLFQPDRSLPKENPLSYRVHAAPPDLARLRRQFVDHRTGIITNEVRHPHGGWYPLSEAQLALSHWDDRESSFGRELDYSSADRVALLESLERYAGLYSLSQSQPVVGSYTELSAEAIDPASLILHHPDAYTKPGTRLVPYHPDLRFRWVWAYSFRERSPRLVPEQAAYYGELPETAGARFLYETSNGCALGSSLEEAAFHGLLEILERDATLLTWYARLPAPRLDLSHLTDPLLLDVIDRVGERGYQVDAFNVTADVGLPAIAVMAWRPKGDGAFASFSAGAHPDPLRALRNGLMEAVASIPSVERRYAQERDQFLRLLQKEQVETLDDHQFRSSLPEVAPSFAFLLAPGRLQPWQAAWDGDFWRPEPDLAADLRKLVDRVLQAGMDVLVVDQTPPELRAQGLYAARVLVPGSLPLTFGYRYRRVDGATRLYAAPPRMGFRPPAAINEDPHPFC